MQGSLFARFRSADGRSFVRALIALVLANAIVAGIHLAPASAATATICSIAASANNGGDTPAPGGASDHPCCAAGCMPVGLAAPDAAEVTLPAPNFVLVIARAAVELSRDFVAPAPPARGPPSLA